MKVRMNPEIKARWIKALTSGEYRQGQNVLHSVNEHNPTAHQNVFCCLGVLCDLHAKETGGTWTVAQFGDGELEYLGAGAELPATVKFWADFPEAINADTDDDTTGYDPEQVLIGKNDSKGENFDQIAHWIEENL